MLVYELGLGSVEFVFVLDIRFNTGRILHILCVCMRACACILTLPQRIIYVAFIARSLRHVMVQGVGKRTAETGLEGVCPLGKSVEWSDWDKGYI